MSGSGQTRPSDVLRRMTALTPERRCLRFWIVGRDVQEHSNPSHPLALLRARRERPRRRAADERDELASSHWRPRQPEITNPGDDDNTMDVGRDGRKTWPTRR